MATNSPDHLEVAHAMSEDISAEHSEEVPDLFVCLDECYIYSDPGDDNGNPKDDADILYDTVIDEIIQLEVPKDTNDYKRIGKYVQCIKPVKGWVYLPEFDAQYDWGPLDDIYQAKRRARDAKKKAEEAKNGKKKDDKDKDENKGQYDEDGYMNPIDENIEFKDEQEEYYDETLIVEDRRDYSKQRMMMQTVPPELDMEVPKALQIGLLRWLIFYFRRNPFMPGLIILIIQLVIEIIIAVDVYSDVALALEIRKSRQPILFMISASFIVAPYAIAWTAASAMNAKKMKQNRKSIWFIVGGMLFNIAPIGIFFLLVVDVYHLFECVFIKPIFYLFTCGKQIRTISYGELGYYKLRRVSEIFAEAMPQAVVQLYILVSGGAGCEGCTLFSVLMALGSSFFVLLLWCTILTLEGKKNGMGFVEYVTVVFQGSFNFVEMLPAIERGTPSGRKVNWTLYKFSDEGVGHVAKALNTPTCKLELLKLSKYTIKDLDRFGCRFLGGALAQSERNIEIIISRLEDEIIELFDKYDVDQGKSLDFEEFVHLCLDIKQNMREPCLRSDVFLIYEELADSVQHEVWQLDLQVKIKGSLEYIGLLDYKLPLQNAYESGDLNLMSFLMAAEYDKYGDDQLAEFEWCVSDAVTKGKAREALCLCEHKGVPLVVRMESGRNLMACDEDGKSDPYVRVQIFDQVQITQYRKQTLNPNWEEDLLFIVPFEFMERILHVDDYKEEYDQKEDGDEFIYGKDDLGNTTRGISFAAIDIDTNTVTGLRMPEYAQKAIQQDLKNTYNRDFDFQIASSSGDLKKRTSNIPGLMKRATSDPTKEIQSSGNILSSDAAHSAANKARYGNSSGKLSIRFRVFDHDVDDDDDFMGSYKERVVMEENTAKFHENLINQKLQNNQEPDLDVGQISYRIFLNVVQIFQEHELHYIDSEHKDKEINLFKMEVTDRQHAGMSDVLPSHV